MIYTSPHPDVDVPDQSLPSFILGGEDTRTAQPALIDGPTGRTLTYGELQKAVTACAGGLAARGLEKGDVFAIYSPNLPEYAIAFYGVARAGGTVTTINPLYTAHEAARQLRDAEARYLLTVPSFFEQAEEAAANAGIDEVFVFGDAEGGTPFESLLHGDHAPPTVSITPDEDLVALPYSSGTTGLPKGVQLTHRNLVANIAQTMPVERLHEGETTVGVLPFYHIYGMTIILSMALRCGATVVTMPRFEMENFCARVETHGIESGYLVPPIILGLAKSPVVDEYDLSSLDYITSGAAPLGKSVAEACADRLGCRVKQGYGLTETSPVTHLVARDAEDTPLDSVGHAVPNTEFRVVDVDTHEDVEPGERGELWIRGPQVMTGYLNRPDATADTIDADGWLHTGDVATVDPEERVYIVDRVKELIKYKGHQVAPAELEALLQAHDKIGDAAVIPSPDEEAGEVPKALVVEAPDSKGLTATEVMSYVAQRVAPQKKVRRVEFIDEVPKTASGKILRRDLIEQERKQQN
jgi:acyl-CoA synthetase (AMP-forming)/AMP-acid ligase II